MNKYIEAEKLIAEIERLIGVHTSKRGQDEVAMNLNYLKKFTTSLQQEPRFPQYNNIVEKVFGAGNIEGFEYREAEMLVALAKEELLKSLQQEPPEADLREVVMIDNIIMNMTGEGYNEGFKTRPFYEEVVRRVKAKKED